MGKILVAEDSLIVNQHIKHTLGNGGHEVISVYSGKEAVRVAGNERPDLILMDIMMETNSDGIDAAMEIKQTLDIPIIFLTALTDDPTIQKAKTSLPYGYVVKPFNEAELLSNIDVALFKAKAERKIKENSELFRTIIESIDKAVFLLDKDNNIKYTNKIAENIAGARFDQLIDQSIHKFLIFKDHTGKIYDDLVGSPAYSDAELCIDGLDLVYGDFASHEVELDQRYVLFFFKDISDRVRMREVREEIKNRKLLSFIEGQEKERERIARDLHDGVGQIANMIKLSVKQGNVGDTLVSMVDQFLDEMRKVTDGLLPTHLGDFPIDACIRKLVDQANKSSQISFEFQSDSLPKLSMNYKVNIYRIVQENIANILKHSKASQASIQFYKFNDYLQLTIEDDGVGFNPQNLDDSVSHHGVQNMHFRAEAINAELEVDSKIGSGTCINITIPHNEES